MTDTNKFKGCFIDESDLYLYTIEYDGMPIAKAHTLSAKDKSAIERNSITKRFNNETGELDVTFDSQQMMTWQILGALDSWELGRPITEENVSKLDPVIREHICSAVRDHEAQVAVKVADTEKN